MAAADLIAAFAEARGLGAAFSEQAAGLHQRLALLIAAAARGRRSPLVVGLCGPQGSGKSTLAASLRAVLEAERLSTAVLSIDDLYLTRAERRRLAESVQPLLLTRGPPGTHDPALGIAVLDALARSGPVRLPRFDKATDDRTPEADWPLFEGPADVVLFEGWCVGARPQPPAALTEPVNALERERDPGGVWRGFVDAALAGPYHPLFARLDLLIQLRAPGWETVIGWRQEQERTLRRALTEAGADLSPTLTDAEVVVFVQHYERLTRFIDAEMPARADVVVQLGEDRRALAIKTRSGDPVQHPAQDVEQLPDLIG